MARDQVDFIVVGAGPSGSSLSYRLASSAAKPSVLLIESGGPNDALEDLVAGERHLFWATNGLHLDRGYKTQPQGSLKDRELAYHRGKGLGGSTATNLGLWDYGSKPEYDEWARIVGDDVWKWESVCAYMKKIENCRNNTPDQFSRYVKSISETRGTDGPVDVTLPAKWDPSLPLILNAVEKYGFPLNPDVNSDQCIGFGIPPSTTHAGLRVTAATSYLSRRPANLNILTGKHVSKILFRGDRAQGVETGSGQRYYASKEVIICSGAIDTPKLLLLSGIGPSPHLAEHGIPIVKDNPYIGANLKDHPMIRLGASIKEGVIDQNSPVSKETAKEQWLSDRTGPLAEDIGSTGHGYFKLDVHNTPEFNKLDIDTQKHLAGPLTPAYELVTRMTPSPTSSPTTNPKSIWTAAIVIMNNQSTGHIKLRSSNHQDPPLIDLNFLSNPYDLRVTIEAVREITRFFRSSTNIIPIDDEFIAGPKSLDEEDIVEYIRSNLSHLWHAAGTVRMGKEGRVDTCVTPDFRVVGVDGLRVADLSVLPLMPSNHTQSTAYLVGEVAADKLIKEYELN